MNGEHISRRVLLNRVVALGMLTALQRLLPTCATTPSVPATQTGTQASTLSGQVIDLMIGETATLVRQQGGDPSQIRFVVGLRAWF